MPQEAKTPDYYFGSSAAPHTGEYLTPQVVAALRAAGSKRVLDLGCGNGAMCADLAKQGFEVVGCDPSEDGIKNAQLAYPGMKFYRLGVYDNPALLEETGFDAVIATEVIEHLIHPRSLLTFTAEVLRPGGVLILTTPYHGYLKNLALSLTGKMDSHFTVLWDGGHIKFWSRGTLTALLTQGHWKVLNFVGIGRCPYLWRSMLIVAERPGNAPA
jgi:2-polyprenyl-3-methyl-5-hydroxy-6-metoxy-1,4-benzoquinol methylase